MSCHVMSCMSFLWLAAKMPTTMALLLFRNAERLHGGEVTDSMRDSKVSKFHFSFLNKKSYIISISESISTYPFSTDCFKCSWFLQSDHVFLYSRLWIRSAILKTHLAETMFIKRWPPAGGLKDCRCDI
jgi:hypothetical protein